MHKTFCAVSGIVRKSTIVQNIVQLGFYYPHRGKYHEGLYNVKICIGGEVKHYNKFRGPKNISRCSAVKRKYDDTIQAILYNYGNEIFHYSFK